LRNKELNLIIITRNGDGVIDRNEFYWTFPELDLYEEFGRFDVDNSGFIELDEVERANLSLDRQTDVVDPNCRGCQVSLFYIPESFHTNISQQLFD
jgi:Ca2+-binding EF-hand superfamily protein